MEDHFYCRLCLSENNLIHMKGPILGFIKNIFLLEIYDADDGVSQEICEHCNSFVLQIIKFKDKVDKVQKVIRKIIKRKMLVDPDKTNKIIDHIVIVDQEETSARENGGTNAVEDLTDLKQTLKADESELIEEDQLRYEQHMCKFCKKAFGFKQTLQHHVEKKHKNVCICPHCDFTSINKKCFSKHLRKKHFELTQNQRICSICFKICNSYADLHEHRKNNHDVEILNKQKNVHRTQMEKEQNSLSSSSLMSIIKTENTDLSSITGTGLEEHDESFITPLSENPHQSPSEIKSKFRRMKARATNLKNKNKINKVNKHRKRKKRTFQEKKRNDL